jgi:hypothetical protein
LQRRVARIQHVGLGVVCQEVAGQADGLSEFEHRVARAAVGAARDENQIRFGGNHSVHLLFFAAAVAEAERVQHGNVAGGGEPPRALQRAVGEEAHEHGAHRRAAAGRHDEHVCAAAVRRGGHDEVRRFVEQGAAGDGLQFCESVAHPFRGFEVRRLDGGGGFAGGHVAERALHHVEEGHACGRRSEVSREDGVSVIVSHAAEC